MVQIFAEGSVGRVSNFRLAAYICRFFAGACMSRSSGVEFFSRTVRHTRTNKDTTNICSHINTNLITHLCTLIDYFNKV